MITLSFRPLSNGSVVLVRGAYFRICADGTLRGPDNGVASRYIEGLWHLGDRRHVAFECVGPVYLRVTGVNGRREGLGPYAFIKAAEGALFTQDSCLGVHAGRKEFGSTTLDRWREVAILTSLVTGEHQTM